MKNITVLIKIENNKLRKCIGLLRQAVEVKNPTRLEKDGIVHRFENAFDITCRRLKNRWYRAGMII